MHAAVPCERCGVASDRAIQFKFGDVWQYDYEIGDTLTWGGNVQGEPGWTQVVALGVVEDECPNCGLEESDVGVLIEHDVVTAVVAPPAIDDLDPEHCFWVVER